MEDQPRPALVAALVETLDRRTTRQTEFVMRALTRAAWPGGHDDRHDPAAVEWVRRWAPARAQQRYIDDCSCAAGRCAVCN
jgi:hypothetical protein